MGVYPRRCPKRFWHLMVAKEGTGCTVWICAAAAMTPPFPTQPIDLPLLKSVQAAVGRWCRYPLAGIWTERDLPRFVAISVEANRGAVDDTVALPERPAFHAIS
jgi:hypothetical protein